MQQETANRVGLIRQHLLDEVVDDVPVVPGEPCDESADVVAPLDRERSELKRGNPPLSSVRSSKAVTPSAARFSPAPR